MRFIFKNNFKSISYEIKYTNDILYTMNVVGIYD